MVNKSRRKGYRLGLKRIDRLRSWRDRPGQGEETGRSCRKKRSGRKTLRRLLFHAFDACKNHRQALSAATIRRCCGRDRGTAAAATGRCTTQARLSAKAGFRLSASRQQRRRQAPSAFSMIRNRGEAERIFSGPITRLELHSMTSFVNSR